MSSHAAAGDGSNNRFFPLISGMFSLLLIGGGIYYFGFFMPSHDRALRADIIREMEETWKNQDAIRRQVDSAKITNIFLEQLEYTRSMSELNSNAADLLRRLTDLGNSVELYQKQFNDYRISMQDSFERRAGEEKKQQQEFSASLETLNARNRELAEDAGRILARLEKLTAAFETFRQKQAAQSRAVAEAVKKQELQVNKRLQVLEERVARLAEPSQAPVAR